MSRITKQDLKNKTDDINNKIKNCGFKFKTYTGSGTTNLVTQKDGESSHQYIKGGKSSEIYSYLDGIERGMDIIQSCNKKKK